MGRHLFSPRGDCPNCATKSDWDPGWFNGCQTINGPKINHVVRRLVKRSDLQYIFRYGWRTRIWGGAAKLERTLRSRLFWHFMKMDTTFFQKHRTGDLMAHATNDLTAIQQVAGAGILTFADSIITGGTTIIAMVIFVDWRLTLMALIPMPLLAVASRRLGAHLHTAFGQSQAAFSRLNDKTQESVSGIKVLKRLAKKKLILKISTRLSRRQLRLINVWIWLMVYLIPPSVWLSG